MILGALPNDRSFVAKALSLLFLGFIAYLLLLAEPCGAATVQKSVAELLGTERYITLDADHSRLSANWVIPAQRQVSHATLMIHYFVGPSTVPGTELVVALNGKDVGAVRENPSLPQGLLTVLLDAGTLQAGEHDLSITLRSPDSSSKSLAGGWTQIDAYQSQLQFHLQLAPWKKIDFADLNTLLQGGQGSTIQLPVVFVGAVSPTLLQAAQQAVAGIAMRTDDAVAVQVLPSIAQARRLAAPLTLLLGAKGESGTVNGAPQNGARILLHPLTDSGTALELVFSGNDDADVLRAARAFAGNLADLPLGNDWAVGPSTGVSGRLLSWRGQPVLLAGTRREIGTVEQINSPLGSTSSLLRFSFWMPGGQFADRQKQMILNLNLAVEPHKSAGQRPLVTIRANGNWVSQWKLGGGVGHYETTIPFSSLEAGNNQISIEVDGATVTALPGSSLRLPQTHEYASLPDLRLLARTGFPLVQEGTGKRLRFVYLDPKPAFWAAGLTLFGKLAQESRSALSAATVRFGYSSNDSDLNQIIIGTPERLSPAMQDRSPIEFRGAELRWRSAGRSWTTSLNPQARAYLLEVPGSHGAKDWNLWFLVPETQSPVTAAASLVHPTNWSALHGNFAWLDPTDRYHSMLLGEQVTFGDRVSPWFWIYLFSVRPIWWVAVVLAVIFLGTLSASWLAQHRRRQWGEHG